MKIGENIKIIPPEMYECDECGKSFKFKSQLKNHEKPCQNRLRRQAQKENALKTPKPADKSAGENRMIIGPEIYKCSECEMTFKFRTGLRRTGRPERGRPAEAWFRTHLLRHENDHKRLKRQAQKQNMKKAPKPADKSAGENKMIIGPEIYKCNECEMTFKFRTGLRRTGRPGRGRTAEAWFRTHLLRHENDHKRLRRQAQKQNMKKAPKPADEEKNVSEMHECNVCTKKFKTKAGV